jgi:hypothetical protein
MTSRFSSNAGDMDVNIVRHPKACHFRPEFGIARDKIGRDAPGLDDLLRAIDIGKEQIEGFHPLHKAGFEAGPFRAQHHAGNDIERDQPLGSVLFSLTINRESDADPAKQQLRLRAARGENPGRRRREPTRDLAIDWPDRAVRQGHFIEASQLRHWPALLVADDLGHGWRHMAFLE